MNRIRRIRRALGLSQVEMAQRLGVSRRYLQLQEAADRPAKLTALAALCLARITQKKRTAYAFHVDAAHLVRYNVSYDDGSGVVPEQRRRN